MSLSRYFEENFFVIPIKKNDKRPLYKAWTDYSLSLEEAKQYVKEGYNLAVVSGKQSIKEGYYLVIVDIDSRPAYRGRTHEWYDFFTDYNTWISFTPNNGYHIYLRVRPFELQTKLQQFLTKWNLNPHRTTVTPNHQDNTLPSPRQDDSEYFADTIRWTSMYALLKPSKIDEKSYWWLNDAKGEILKL